MKKYMLAGILLLFLNVAFAQGKDAVVGRWRSEHGSGELQIYRTGEKYFGKLVWMKEPNDANGRPKLDIYNPSENLRSKPVLGLDVLKNLEYKSKGQWDNGTVYNPKSGKSYSCKMSMTNNPDKLTIKGYMGFSFIGKSETWTRVH